MLREQMTFTPVCAARNGKIRFRRTSSRLTLKDHMGGMLVRWDIGRNGYRVEPGLYAIGEPDRDSPVLVTSNYKLTFDSVRKELAGVNAWILVLDTHGVNVWCAAGKGTFGTEELVHRIKAASLPNIVAHRDLVLPQLGASGIAAHKVTASLGFKVHYGPVYAKNLRKYLSLGMKKTDGMRDVRFPLRDRLAVAPVEIAHAVKLVPATLAAAALFSFPFDGTFPQRFRYNILSLGGGIFAGTVLFPALLPVLPFRAFAAKGAFLGLVWSALSFFAAAASVSPSAYLPAALVSVPLVSYLSMNFTGSSTFTCQKGAELEVKFALPPMLVSLAGGIALAACNIARALK